MIKNENIKYILIFSLLIILSCNETNIKSKKIETYTSEIDTINRDTIEHCWCEDYNFNDVFSYEYDIEFRGKWYLEENEKLFKYWSNDTLKNKVKKLNISLDTIPEKYGIFRNVEEISFNGIGCKIVGIECFKKIKKIRLNPSAHVFIDTSKFISDNLEALGLYNARISGIDNYKPLQNLSYLEMLPGYFSEKNIWTDSIIDITKLKKLQYLNVCYYKFKTFNLETIDLKKMPCLKHLEITAIEKFKIDTTVINLEFSNLDYFDYYVDMSKLYKKSFQWYLDSIMNYIKTRNK